MTTDRNFDDLAEKFERHIYGTPKGDIRQAVLWQDLTKLLAQCPKHPLSILDVGCGMANLSRRLARAGHQVTLCDISNQLLQRAQAAAEQEGADQHMQFFHCALQEIKTHLTQPVDLILCHAVLEWTANPEQVLQTLSSYLSPGGHLLLLFYNEHGLLLRNLLLGNFQHIAAGMPKRYQRSLQPDHPLNPVQVDTWLTALHLQILNKTAVRVLYDYWPKTVRQQLDLDTILTLEQRYCRELPFIHLGRYLHVIASKPN